MKRVIAISLLLSLLATVFVGCKKEKPTDINTIINTAFDKVKKSKYISLTTTTNVKYEGNKDTTSFRTESNIKEANIGSKDKYEMSAETTVETYGSESTYEAYYKKGYYYTNRYGGNFKTKLDAKDAKNYSAKSTINIEFNDMKTVALKDVKSEESGSQDSFQHIRFTCKNKTIREYILGSIDDNTENTPDEINIIGSDGLYVIDKDGNLVSESLSVSANMITNGDETTVTVSTKTVYSEIGKKVNPYDPEDSDFTEVANLNDVIAFNSAWVTSASPYNENISIDMKMSANIEQDKNKFGYEREYFRKLSVEQEKFAQEVKTIYKTENSNNAEPMVSRQYYTDGKFYNSSDVFGHKVSSKMDFKTYFTGIYIPSSQSPAHIYVPGMMANIKSEKQNKDTVYSFDLNAETESGVKFLQMLFGPYDQFGGDCAAAEKVINSFSGKSYVDENGYYYKTVVEGDILLKFEEGDVRVKCKQEVNINKVTSKDLEFEFPSLEGYEKIDQADLLSSYGSN